MCLGELGVVIGRAERDGVVRLRTERGESEAIALLVSRVETGDAVLVHSGHVVAVLTPAEAAAAQAARTGDGS